MQIAWKPTKRQEDFISLPDEIFEALYGGQAGGGKSEILLMLPLVREFHKHPRFKGLILRRTSPELERELVIRSQVDGYYSATGAMYSDQKKRWKFPDGGILQFGHIEHEKDVRIYDTAEYNYIGWDEGTSFTPYQYEHVTFSRCRSSSDNLPAISRIGSNPGGPSHDYFKRRFVVPNRYGNVIIKEIRKISGINRETLLIFIPSKATDNPHLMKGDPDYVNRLQRLPEADRLAKAEGDWFSYSGQVFEDFRANHLESEPANVVHVIPPFKIPYYWPKLLSIDWGYEAMTHALWWAINPKPCQQYPAKIYTYREYHAKKEKISTWASNLARLSQGEELTDVVIDPSAFGHRGDAFTIAEQFALSFGRAARRADNDRIGGKLLMQEYLRWKPNPPKFVPQEGFDSDLAMRILRMKGEKSFKEYEHLFVPETEEIFLPKWQLFEGCEKLINVIPNCVYDKSKKEDVAEFNGDDPYDNARYGLKACQFYLDGGMLEHEHVEQVSKICSTLEQTGDLTSFYIKMGNIEAKKQKGQRPVRRFHRGRMMR